MVMGVTYYQFGNPIKAKLRKHFCYKCGTKLEIVKHRRVVSQKSEIAKYYHFALVGDHMIGDCLFIHNVFYCPHCKKNIEFITQLSLEDVDIIIDKVIKKYRSKNIEITIKKQFETKFSGVIEKTNDLEDVENLQLMIFANGKRLVTLLIPKLRMKKWERPYHFKISKRQIVKAIKKRL